MPEEPDVLGSRPGLFLLVGCLFPFLAVLIGGGCLLTHHFITTPVSPYQVKVADSGEACSEDHEELFLDSSTGEVLYCSTLPGFALHRDEHAPYPPFSATEVDRVEELSQGLAADGSLSEADHAAVLEVVTEISRANGYTKMSPTLLERLTWQIGWFGLVGGFAEVLALGLYAQFKEGRS